jgi:hypothetical protein
VFKVPPAEDEARFGTCDVFFKLSSGSYVVAMQATMQPPCLIPGEFPENSSFDE